MTVFEVTGEVNYAPQVVRVAELTTLEGLDNLVGLQWAGFQALVSKNTKPGDLMIVFPPESQLSETFASVNNLFSDATRNNDTEIKGYLANNRRVRAIRLRGHASNALAMPLSSLSRFTSTLPDEGAVFDTIDGTVISQKYVVPVKQSGNPTGSLPKWRRVDQTYLPQHFDTGQYFRESFKYAPNDYITVTQKVHGCFPSSMKVSMWDGSQKKIHSIRQGHELVGFDESGTPVKAIAKRDAFTTGQTDKWLRVKFKQPRKGDNPTVTCTPDHQILTPEGYVPANELNIGDVAIFTRNEPQITAQKVEVLNGLMLGDGSIAGALRNSVEWSHKHDHDEYSQYIARLLGNLTGLGKPQHRVSGHGSHMIGYRTQALRQVGLFNEKWRDGVPDDFTLTPLTLAVWYMDDGSRSHSDLQKDRAVFSTCSFSDGDVQIVDQELSRYGFTNYTWSQHSAYKGSKLYWYLRLNKDDAEKLFSDIRHLVPPVMQYKLPEYHRGFFVEPIVVDATGPVVFDASVISSETVHPDKVFPSTKWDVETTTGNFAVNRIAVHNSSVRIARTIVKRRLSWWERLAKRLGVTVAETELAVVGGSRRVIKDPGDSGQRHWYGEGNDIWTQAALDYADQIPAHVIIYGELIGWVGAGQPIQTGYTYQIPEGRRELYVYRVAVIAPDGGLYDLSWNGVTEFCNDHGFKHVPELWAGFHKDFNPDEWIDRRYRDEGFTLALPLSDPKSVDEGICVRREGVIPLVTKCKGPVWYGHETKVLDEGKAEAE